MLFGEIQESSSLERLREEITLELVHAQRRQHGLGAFIFDAFGHDSQVQGPAHLDNRLENATAPVGLASSDQSAMDL